MTNRTNRGSKTRKQKDVMFYAEQWIYYLTVALSYSAFYIVNMAEFLVKSAKRYINDLKEKGSNAQLITAGIVIVTITVVFFGKYGELLG